MTPRTASAPRGGAVVAATWLIGLGFVFLIQQTLDIDWGQAWPLFLILVGVATSVSVVATVRPPGRWMVALAWPILFVVVGTVFLLSTTGALGTELGDLVARWWPLALIVIGAWYLVASVLPFGRAGDQSLAIPLGGATSASIRLKFGGGELSVGPAAADHLLEGEFERASAIHRITGDGQVEVEPADMVWPGVDRAPHWHVGVASSVPLDVDLQGWAGRVRMDFGATMLRRLHLVTGATDTRVTLPRAAGETAVQAEGGAASLVFEVPLGVAARIRSRVALGSTSVDEVRFPRTGSGTWESADYGAATNRIALEVSGGVGSVRVSSVA